MSLECEIYIENLEEVKEQLARIPQRLEYDLYLTFEEIATDKEKELKAIGDFHDRSGRMRGSLYCIAMVNPPGLTFGSDLPYAYWVAHRHGSWLPSWWEDFVVMAIEQVEIKVGQLIRDFTEKINRGE